MTKNDYINYWLSTAKEDLETAISLFDSERYVWSLFIGHLALEKLFKAFWVKNNESNFPPKTHDLNKIVNQADLIFSDKEKEFLTDVSSFNLEARYPDYKRKFNNICTKEFSDNYLLKIRNMFECTIEKI
ncbi:MAG: HEPN domain-containing protein [Ignavibacteriaceae bacterium]|nr:HEPN domain-containing protein [Ignavibacterium sp.]MCC6256043.1 HEPN domain-containing protein [Ignavibacteriaceae bacterium]HRP93412.1 HEPN domain-containing protein [Ignavibacteriaceae bacterium]